MMSEQQKDDFNPLDANVNDILAHLDDVNQDDPRAWPQTLADLVDVFTDHLHRKPLTDAKTEDTARRAAQELIVVLANYFGGRQVYLPRDEKLRLALRDNQIWRDFNGTNIGALEKRWKLTRQQIYNIIAKQRALHKNRS